MKTIKYYFFILFLPMILFSQNEDYLIENGQYYFTKTLNNSVAQEKLNDKSISTDFEIKKKHIVRVVSFDSHTVSYRYLTFNDDDLKKIYNNDDQIFEMSIEDFTYYTNKYINRFRNWKVGAYTVPIRIRSKDNNFEFESNLSLGANITKGVNFSRYGDHGYADFSFGISLTKVNLNENNSDLKNVNPELNTLAQSALTTSLGLTIHLDKNVNFGIFYGWDFLEGSDQEKLKWIHNKKPWLGFGINVSFNANDSSNTSEKANQ